MPECTPDRGCPDGDQCFGLRCFPPDQICYCFAFASNGQVLIMPDTECAKWADPEFFDQDVPHESTDATYFDLRDSIRPECVTPGPAPTGAACMQNSDCQGGLCPNDAMGMRFCSQRCNAAEECNGLACGNVVAQIPPGLNLCAR
jgi:hypothetical protein